MDPHRDQYLVQHYFKFMSITLGITTVWTQNSYADDTTLVFNGKSKSFLEANATDDLKNLVQLFYHSNLKKLLQNQTITLLTV